MGWASGAVGSFQTRITDDGMFEVLIGDTAVQFEGDLDDEAKLALLTSLRPVDMATVIAAVSEDSLFSGFTGPG